MSSILLRSAFRPSGLTVVLLIGFLAIAIHSPAAAATRDVLIEVYYTSGEELGELYLASARELAETRKGIFVIPRDLRDNASNADRLSKIAAHFQLENLDGPLLYGCNCVVYQIDEKQRLRNKLEDLLRFEVFARDGCSRCQAAKELLPGFLAAYPALELSIRYVNRDVEALNAMNETVRLHRTTAASTPVMHFCNQVMIGFDRSAATTERLRKALERWTIDATATLPAAK